MTSSHDDFYTFLYDTQYSYIMMFLGSHHEFCIIIVNITVDTNKIVICFSACSVIIVLQCCRCPNERIKRNNKINRQTLKFSKNQKQHTLSLIIVHQKIILIVENANQLISVNYGNHRIITPESTKHLNLNKPQNLIIGNLANYQKHFYYSLHFCAIFVYSD